jgi:triosephosphate isomerase
MRRKMVAGNWKMNMTPSESVQLVGELKPMIENAEVDVVFCVPSIDIVPVVEAVKGSNINVGAENMYFEEKGAYTGELSANMLVDAGVSYVIIGHSERRQYFNENNEMINKKVKKAIEHQLIPIICCGETLEQREEGITLSFIKEQISTAFDQVEPKDALKCIIAYEPIWAIGTGKVATAAQAQEVCKHIRQCLENIYNQDLAQQMRILYGGSVNAANAAEIFAQEDIDGGLIGGASLKPEFAKIVHYNA